MSASNPSLLDVERLGPVDVGHRHGHELELPIHHVPLVVGGVAQYPTDGTGIADRSWPQYRQRLRNDDGSDRPDAAAAVAAPDVQVLVGRRAGRAARGERTHAAPRRRPAARARLPGRSHAGRRRRLPARGRRTPAAARARRRRGGRDRRRPARRGRRIDRRHGGDLRARARQARAGAPESLAPPRATRCTRTCRRCVGAAISRPSTPTRSRCSRWRAATTSRCASTTAAATAKRGARLVEPHNLVSAGRRWYLVGWDVRRSDWRTFRLDRFDRAAARRRALRAAPAPGRRTPPRSCTSRSPRCRFRSRPPCSSPAPHDDVRAFIRYANATVEAVDDTSCRAVLRSETRAWLGTVITLLASEFEVAIEEPADLLADVRRLSRRLRAVAPATPA